MKDVGLYLVPIEKPVVDWMTFARSEDEGRYEIKWIKPGSYHVIFMYLGLNPVQSDPKTKYYHPGVKDREQAFVLSFGEGQRIEDYTLRLPRLPEQKVIEGIVLDTLGAPVPEALVAYGQPNANQVERVKANDKGRFSFRAYEGVSYSVKVILEKGDEYHYFSWIDLQKLGEKSPLQIVIDPKQPQEKVKRQ
jgi:hypothetical protein